MSIPVPNTVAELTVKARSLGILDSIKGTRKDGSYRKDDLVVPIRKYLLSEKYGDRVPGYLEIIQEEDYLGTIMLTTNNVDTNA